MIASLPMYDWPQLRASHAAFWSAIRGSLTAHGIDSPAQLTQTGAYSDTWTRADLVLSQTCSLPFRTALYDQVHLVGTPDYALDACPPGYYRSHLVVRRDDRRTTFENFHGSVFAVNDQASQSGYAAAWYHADDRRVVFRQLYPTGGHRASAVAVARGVADIASIDAVSWRLIDRFDPCASALRVLESTEPTPGLPYITACCHDPHTVFNAVHEAIESLERHVLEDLTLNAIVRIPAEDYLQLPLPPRAHLTEESPAEWPS